MPAVGGGGERAPRGQVEEAAQFLRAFPRAKEVAKGATGANKGWRVGKNCTFAVLGGHLIPWFTRELRWSSDCDMIWQEDVRAIAGGRGRRETGANPMEKTVAKLENWSVVGSVVFEGYREPEPGQRLTGEVMGHTNLANGIIYTSAIVSIDLEKQQAETRNTVYELGQMSADYERWLHDPRRPGNREVRAA